MLNRLIRSNVEFLCYPNENSKKVPNITNAPTPMHSHKFTEIVLPIKGNVNICLTNVCLRLSHRKLYLILPETLHCEQYYEKAKPYSVLWTVITPQSVNFFVHEYDSEIGYYVSDRMTSYPLQSQRLWAVSKNENIKNNIVLYASFVSELIHACLDALKNMDKTSSCDVNYNRQIVRQIKSYIDLHFAEQINIDEIAQMVRRSPNYVNSIFRRHIGKPIKHYLIWARLNNARKLLANTDFQIKRISMLSGFLDPLYFSRLFKKYFDVSPKNWRELQKTRKKGRNVN